MYVWYFLFVLYFTSVSVLLFFFFVCFFALYWYSVFVLLLAFVSFLVSDAWLVQWLYSISHHHCPLYVSYTRFLCLAQDNCHSSFFLFLLFTILLHLFGSLELAWLSSLSSVFNFSFSSVIQFSLLFSIWWSLVWSYICPLLLFQFYQCWNYSVLALQWNRKLGFGHTTVAVLLFMYGSLFLLIKYISF